MFWPLLFLPFQKVETSVVTEQAKLVAAELRDIAKARKEFCMVMLEKCQAHALTLCFLSFCLSSSDFSDICPKIIVP